MKKILLFCLVFLLTGCGNAKCEKEFSYNMTDNYKEDVKKCKSLKYTSKENNLEIMTTPSEDKNTFLATIKYKGKELDFSYTKNYFKNLNIKTYEDINFIELYDTKNVNNTYLIAFDSEGNVLYKVASTTSPLIEGEQMTVKEFRMRTDGDFICSKYSKLDRKAYIELTFDMSDMTVINEKAYLLKDVCK